MIHATYTHSVPGEGSTIMYARFNEDWVRQGDGDAVRPVRPGLGIIRREDAVLGARDTREEHEDVDNPALSQRMVSGKSIPGSWSGCSGSAGSSTTPIARR